jgi:tetratricopeptide (TPR) repeat protein
VKKQALVLIGLGLSGCAQLTPPSQLHSTDSVEVQTQPQQAAAHLNAPVMFEIMLAEMLVQRGEVVQAHTLLFELAQKQREVALMERVFELAMASYSVARIKQTVTLWGELEPMAPTPWRVGYLMALREGALDEALTLWMRYREHSPLSLEDDLKNAASQALQGTSPETGLAFFEQLVQRYPQTWAAGYAYGYAADQYGQPELAVSILETVVAREDAPDEAYFALANLYVEHDLYARGLVQLNAYVREHPDAWSIQERYARMEVKGGYYAEAMARYQRIVEANPQAYTSKLSLALLLLETGQERQAKIFLMELVAIKGYEDVSHYYLGLIEQGEGAPDKAMAHLLEVKHRSYFVDARLLIAQIIYDQRGLETALASLDELELALDEQRLKVLRAKALLSVQAGQSEQAIAFYRQALDIDAQPQISYALAMLLYEQGDVLGVEQVLSAALAEHPDEPDLLNSLGYLYVEQNRQLDLATAYLDRALVLAPDSYYILDSRAWLAYRQGDLSLAESLIKRAWALYQDETVLVHMIQIKWALGKRARAEALWQTYHTQFKSSSELQNLLKNLREKP